MNVNNGDDNMKTIEFDDQNLLEVAEVIKVINPYLSGWELHTIINSMKNTANTTNWNRYGYVSILGYVLSAYHIDKNTLGIKASVSSFTIKTFLENSVEKKKVA